jgi:hypothetical protein
MAVVVRYRDYEGTTPDQRVDLMRAFADAGEADREAARLNAVAERQAQSTRYFVNILYQRDK